MPSKYPSNALIPYITYGDPDAQFTEALIDTCFKSGADMIEIGVPFSDPIADGPVIQSSHHRALQTDPNISLTSILKLVHRTKTTYGKPIVLMSAANLIFHFGIEAFFKSAQAHQLDGIVIPDLTVEEAGPYLKAGKAHNVDVILLISPLCSPKRMTKIIQETQGFLYLMAATGTTGERDKMDESLANFAKSITAKRDIPIYVGFGISKPEHVQAVCRYAQGAIVGSYLVKIIENHLHNPTQALAQVGAAIRTLKGK